ncbi:MAG: histidinol-phosphatase [Sphaerochaetaceae bacterium]
MRTIYTPNEVNLHTHSFFCGHGSGQLTDYVKEAKQGSITLLGFTEHAPLPDESYSRSRMAYRELESYLDECRTLQASEEEIKILTGLECDQLDDWYVYYREDLKGSGKVDFLCGGVHFVDQTYVPYLEPTTKNLFAYTDDYTEMIRSLIFDYGVHPDLYCAFYQDWDKHAILAAKSILEVAEAQKLPLEINGNGMRKGLIETPQGLRYPYPRKEFWELAATYDVKVIANSDAHHPHELYAMRQELFDFAKECGVKLSVISLEDKEFFVL